MKRNTIIFLLTGLFILACGKTEEPAADREKFWTDQQRQEYEEEIATRLKAYGVDIVQMKLDKDKLDKAKQAEYEDKIEQIENRHASIDQELQELKTAVDTSWIHIKYGIDISMESLDVQVDSTKINLKKELE